MSEYVKVKKSELDNLNNEIDLILTNPPFGASFGLNEIIENIGDNSIIFSKSEIGVRIGLTLF